MAINKSGGYWNRGWVEGMGYPMASIHPLSAPILSITTWLSLLGYLIMLALTQTSYGMPFMTMRWIMLGFLSASSVADMMLVSTRGTCRMGIGTGQLLTIYLLLTFSSVIYAENWLFSGVRWASHAAMLATLLVFLPQLITLRQIKNLLIILKYIMTALVGFSWFFKIPETILGNSGLYQGAMGNSNAMGHISFIMGFLFLHDVITARTKYSRLFAGAMATAAIITVWQSGARSSMIALSVSVLLLYFYYVKQKNSLGIACLILGSLIMIAFPNLPQEISRFAQKAEQFKTTKKTGPMQSRLPVWTAAYEGFAKRPLLGWGFGADSHISKEWKIQPTAVGTVERDAVNDFMFMLEGCGGVGLAAYLLLIFVVWKQRPGKLQRHFLKNIRSDQKSYPREAALYHLHVAFFVLPSCLLILNQFDNSALSAGNLMSATLWLSAGCASVLRHELSSSSS